MREWNLDLLRPCRSTNRYPFFNITFILLSAAAIDLSLETIIVGNHQIENLLTITSGHTVIINPGSTLIVKDIVVEPHSTLYLAPSSVLIVEGTSLIHLMKFYANQSSLTLISLIGNLTLNEGELHLSLTSTEPQPTIDILGCLDLDNATLRITTNRLTPRIDSEGPTPISSC